MAEETTKKEPGEKQLDKLTVKELREIAKEIPHEKAIHDMKKEELVTLIKEARGIKDEKPVAKKKQAVKIKMTKPELKTRIRELKLLKSQAMESKERKEAALLRRRISRLKKKSRRVIAA